MNKKTASKLSKNVQQGQALIELIVTIAMASTILVSITLTMISIREALSRNSKSFEGNLLLQKQIEAIRSIKDSAWLSLTSPGTYHVEQSGDNWAALPGTAALGIFTYSFTVENVCRLTAEGSIVSCSDAGALLDASTKKIISSVSWSSLGTKTISSSFYLARYANNSSWVQTSQADFNTGTKVGTVVTPGGEVQLGPSSGGTWTSPQVVAVRNLGGTTNATDIFVANDRAYITTLSQAGADFFIYDVSNPANPTLLGSLDLASDAYAVVVSGNYAYVATSHNSREMTVVNVTNPATPTLAGSHFNSATAADGRGIAVSSNRAYLVTNNNTTGVGYEFYTINISNPLSPAQLGGINLNAAARDISLSGNFAYVASTHNNQELQVINVTNNNPTFAGSYNTPGASDGNSVFVVGTTVYIASAQLTILNASNPSSITLVGTFNAAGTPFGVFVSGTLAFLAHSQANSEFKTIDISTPSSPQLYGSADLNGAGFGAFVVGDYAYLATGNDSGEFQVVRGGSGVYQTSGTFESQTFDSLAGVSFNYLTSTLSKPAGTNLRLQVATNNDGSTWNYLGPDGTGATYFDPAGAIHLSQTVARYFRFKASFTGDGVSTPVLFDSAVNYSP